MTRNCINLTQKKRIFILLCHFDQKTVKKRLKNDKHMAKTPRFALGTVFAK
jgi:hypothetical protein